jgi:glycosyltransferase involved in cell wall biosynthesis
MSDVVRMLPVFNEIDVLPQNIDWYHRAGIRTVVIDNGSTDGSSELCRAALAEGRIERLARHPTEEFELLQLLARVHLLARECRPQWLMLTAADEFFETASGEPLLPALREDFHAGYNLIKFYNMEFWMTERDDAADPDPLTRMRHYSCYDVDMYRAYPNLEGLDLLRNFGHRPTFPHDIPGRVSPRLYVSRHYKLRNMDQAQRKVRRIRPTRNEPHAHVHYRNFGGPDDFVVPARRLHRYAFDHRWNFDSVFDGRRDRPRATLVPPAATARR